MMFTRQDINNSGRSKPSLNSKPAERYQSTCSTACEGKSDKILVTEGHIFQARVAGFSYNWSKNKIKTNTAVSPLCNIRPLDVATKGLAALV